MAIRPSLLASPGPAATGPDAAVISACNAFSAIQIDLQTWATGPAAEVRQPNLEAAFKRMLSSRATTLEGFQARARALAIYQEDGACASGPWPDAMLEVLLRDMLGLPEDDGQLIALCADFEANEKRIRGIYDDTDRTLDDNDAQHAAAPYRARIPMMLDRMGELWATTPAGIHARARVLAAVNGDAAFSIDAKETVSARLYAYLCRDARSLQMGSVAP